MFIERSFVKEHGFTLVELSVVLLVVTLILTGFIHMLRLLSDRASFSETRQALEDASQSLLAYATANEGKLPCPAEPLRKDVIDDDHFGVPRDKCDEPNSRRGLIPWKILGIQGTDAWGHYIAYEMTSKFADGTGAYGLNTKGSVNGQDAASGGVKVVSTGSVVAAVWSLGPNGNLGINPSGIQQPASRTSADESANDPIGKAVTVVTRPHSSEDAAGGPFDDQVLLISRFTLYQRLQNAGICIPKEAGQSPPNPYPCP